MWKKTLRNHHPMNYRKKYKCPVCNEYTLNLIHDYACECQKGCMTDDIDINKIIEANDFIGYYTSQELEKYFFINDRECNQIFKNIANNSTLPLLSDRENKMLESFFEKTTEFDIRLDDIMAQYLNANDLKDVQNLTPYGYIINLIEDIHFFINLCCKDLVLFNYGVEFASKHFYSGRFFYNNAVEHLFQANERIYVTLGIFYDFNFNNDLELNKSYKIEKFLKKDVKYKASQYKVIFEKIKSNNFYNELKEIRDSNSHDLSYMPKRIDQDIRNNKNSSFWNRNGDEVDKDVYSVKIKNIIFCLNEYYNLLDHILKHVEIDTSLYTSNSFPMFNYYQNLDHQNITFKDYSVTDYDLIENSKNNLFPKLRDYNNQLIVDAFFRLDEVLHCIRDIFELSENYFYKWRNIGIELEGLIDEQYLLYSALIRLYSCYDKISRHIAATNSKYSKIEYFGDFINVTDNDRIINKIRNIIKDENYKLLFQLRNDIYHNLRAGCLYGNQGLEYYNMILEKIVFENTIIIYNLIDCINPNYKIKAGRNDLCPCGSGKKFKKCCGL